MTSAAPANSAPVRGHPALAALVLVALAARLLLNQRAFYGYEVTYLWQFTPLPWPQALKGAVASNHAPLAMLLKPWLALWPGEWGLRVYASLWGAAAVAMAHWAMRRSFGERAAWLAAIFTAFAPFALQVSLSPRYENQMLFWGWCHLGGLLWVLARPGDKKAWGVYGLSGVLGAFAFAYWFYLLAATALVAWRWLGWRRAGPWLMGVAVACAPAVALLWWQKQTYGSLISDAAPLGLGLLKARLVELVFGLLGGYYTSWFAPEPFEQTGKGLMALLVLAAAWRAWRLGGVAAWAIKAVTGLTLLAALFGWGKLGLRIAPKYMVVLLPPVLAVLAAALAQPKKLSTVGLVLMALVMALGGAGLWRRVAIAHNNATAARLAAARLAPGETLWVTPASFHSVPRLYAPGLTVRGLPADHDDRGDSLGAPLTPEALGAWLDQLPPGQRVVVFYGQGLKPYTDPGGVAARALARRYRAATWQVFAEDNFFEPRARLVCYQPMRGEVRGRGCW